MKTIKRDGTEEDFNLVKIINAVKKANNSVEKDKQLDSERLEKIISTVQKKLEGFKTIKVEDIQDMVESSLVRHNCYDVAKAYIIYRDNKKKDKKYTEDEEKIIAVCECKNEDVKQDNANKNPVFLGTQRDYIAGTKCKTIGRKKLPKKIVEAHDKGLIHWHDMDYNPTMRMTNCCLVNLKDMLKNGFMLNSTFIHTPSSFSKACNLACQIALHVCSSQYGGQTMSWAHLAEYVDISRKNIRKEVEDELKGLNISLSKINEIVEKRVRKEVEMGVKTLQYQILTLSGTNGQSPFISMAMNFDECESNKHKEDLAIVIEEVLKQRMKGVLDSEGNRVSPLFPKLLYFLDDETMKGGKYHNLTLLARDCNNERVSPDFISSKVQKKLKHINHSYPCMGCRSFLTTEGSYIENGVEKRCDENFYGRHNNAGITINLPYVALESKGDIDKFWKILDERLELIYQGFVERYKSLKGTKAEVAPILWMWGGLTRKKADETIDDVITGWRSTYSLGYVGLWETSLYMTKKNLVEDSSFALSILNFFNKKHNEWHKRLMDKNNPNSFLNTSSYGTPEEQTTTKFACALKRDFGVVEGVSDHDYVTNSYHVNPNYEIDAFNKLKVESEFLSLSTGGAVSYIEIPNMSKNMTALEDVIEYIGDTILYAECNVRRDICYCCNYKGEIKIVNDNGKRVWECPSCKNRDTSKMYILRRVCGYIGNANTGASQGRMADYEARVLHL